MRRRPNSLPRRTRGFSLLELLVSVAIVSLVAAILLPAMSAARRRGLSAACSARLRELGRAFQMYGDDFNGSAMPLAYFSTETIGTGPPVYWWGASTSAGVEHRRGFLWAFLQTGLDGASVFACPSQPWGSYKPQGAAKRITSTYGYNGYYLAPASTPGWADSICRQSWKLISNVKDPARVFAFADTLIDLGGRLPSNNALLDPPMVYRGGDWSENASPTTAFRHDGRAVAVHVDGHVAEYPGKPEWLTSRRFGIGAVGRENGPHYVPDWQHWSGKAVR